MQNLMFRSAPQNGIAWAGFSYNFTRDLSNSCQVLITPKTAPNTAMTKVNNCELLISCSIESLTCY